MSQRALRCDDVEALADEWLDGTLSERQRRLFDEHLVACGACQRRVEHLRATIAILRAAATGGPGPSPRVRRALLDAFRRRHR